MATFTIMSRCHEWRGGWVPEEGSREWIRERRKFYAAMNERPGKRETGAVEFAELDPDAQAFIIRKLGGRPNTIHWVHAKSCKNVRRAMPGQVGEVRTVSGLVFNRMLKERGQKICFYCKREFEQA